MRVVLLIAILFNLTTNADECARIIAKIGWTISQDALIPNFPRKAGILLHPISLPGKHGIGEIGPQARKFADILEQMDQKIWQMLPTGPTGYGDSPYQSLSSFAHNHLLISLEDLITDGYLLAQEAAPLTKLPTSRIDYGALIPQKNRVLLMASERFKRVASHSEKAAYKTFKESKGTNLDDYALFVILKKQFDGAPWYQWNTKYAQRDPKALKAFSEQFHEEIENIKIQQYFYQKQWNALKKYCNEKEIDLVGDLPIFTAHDSVDVWANQKLFQLKPDGKLINQSGTPPSYTNPLGQTWGNPLYNWKEHKASGYKWWVDRLMSTLDDFDQIRIDHFRGFASYWEIPITAPDSSHGRWVSAPGEELFDLFKKTYRERYNKDLPVIVEDLGTITDDVLELKEKVDLPGMNVVIHFHHEAYRPTNFLVNSVAYTSSHDNPTMIGYLENLFDNDPFITYLIREYAEAEKPTDVARSLIEKTIQSRARATIVSMQDLLLLDNSARMNVPGSSDGNWAWRLETLNLDKNTLDWFGKITRENGR